MFLFYTNMPGRRPRRWNTTQRWMSADDLFDERRRHEIRRAFLERMGTARPIREQAPLTAEFRAITERVKNMAVELAKEGELPALTAEQRSVLRAEVVQVMAEHPLFTGRPDSRGYWKPAAVGRIQALAEALSGAAA